MMRGTIPHYNFIGRHINDSLQDNRSQSDREVFCKKLHTVLEPEVKDCQGCPYFGGLMGGYGHECVWYDVYPSNLNSIMVEHKDRYKELKRVSDLIAAGELKKG